MWLLQNSVLFFLVFMPQKSFESSFPILLACFVETLPRESGANKPKKWYIGWEQMI